MFWRDTINLSYLAKWIEETKNSTCKFMSGIIFALEVEKWLLNKWIQNVLSHLYRSYLSQKIYAVNFFRRKKSAVNWWYFNVSMLKGYSMNFIWWTISTSAEFQWFVFNAKSHEELCHSFPVKAESARKMFCWSKSRVNSIGSVPKTSCPWNRVQSDAFRLESSR